MTFEEFFETKWPQHAAALRMYSEGGLAVSYFDILLPRTVRQTAEATWEAAFREGYERALAQRKECAVRPKGIVTDTPDPSEAEGSGARGG